MSTKVLINCHNKQGKMKCQTIMNWDNNDEGYTRWHKSLVSIHNNIDTCDYSFYQLFK